MNTPFYHEHISIFRERSRARQSFAVDPGQRIESPLTVVYDQPIVNERLIFNRFRSKHAVIVKIEKKRDIEIQSLIKYTTFALSNSTDPTQGGKERPKMNREYKKIALQMQGHELRVVLTKLSESFFLCCHDSAKSNLVSPHSIHPAAKVAMYGVSYTENNF